MPPTAWSCQVRAPCPDCMREPARIGLQQAVLDAAVNKPLFGVCVGMQMLLDHSDEGDVPGLGLIPGNVRKFDLEGRTQADGSRFKVPQMGWNQVQQTQQGGKPHALWAGIPDGSFYYFVHSFYALVQQSAHCAAETDYGGLFACAVARDNIFATQFHPRKLGPGTGAVPQLPGLEALKVNIEPVFARIASPAWAVCSVANPRRAISPAVVCVSQPIPIQCALHRRTYSLSTRVFQPAISDGQTC